MSDKDQNLFEENNELSESDISSIFSEGEYEAKTVFDKPEDGHERSRDSASGPPLLSQKSPEKSKVRFLLIILLVLLAGYGVFYFLGLNEAPDTVPSITSGGGRPDDKPVTAAPNAPRADGASVPAITVTLPPPPADEGPRSAGTRLPDNASAKNVDSSDIDQQQKDTAHTVTEPKGSTHSSEISVDSQKVQPNQGSEQQVDNKKSAAIQPVSKGESITQKTHVSAQLPASGRYMLDAGSYLFESNRDALVAKIEKIGFKPLVTPVDASLNMIRLRVGTYGKQDVKNALEKARSIEPGSYSAPAGNGYVIYAGTFLRKDTVEQLKEKFLAEGIKVHLEPVQVVRTLNRIRFGDFQTVEEARNIAQLAEDSGVKSIVVKRQ